MENKKSEKKDGVLEKIGEGIADATFVASMGVIDDVFDDFFDEDEPFAEEKKAEKAKKKKLTPGEW